MAVFDCCGYMVDCQYSHQCGVKEHIMREETETYEGVSGWTTAFKDLRWLDLTVLQHLVGTIGSVAWLKVIMNQPILQEEIQGKPSTWQLLVML